MTSLIELVFLTLYSQPLGSPMRAKLTSMYGLIEIGKVGGLITYAEHSCSATFVTTVLIGGIDPQTLQRPTISSRSSKNCEGTRPYHSDHVPRPRRWGDRISPPRVNIPSFPSPRGRLMRAPMGNFCTQGFNRHDEGAQAGNKTVGFVSTIP